MSGSIEDCSVCVQCMCVIMFLAVFVAWHSQFIGRQMGLIMLCHTGLHSLMLCEEINSYIFFISIALLKVGPSAVMHLLLLSPIHSHSLLTFCFPSLLLLSCYFQLQLGDRQPQAGHVLFFFLRMQNGGSASSPPQTIQPRIPVDLHLYAERPIMCRSKCTCRTHIFFLQLLIQLDRCLFEAISAGYIAFSGDRNSGLFSI